jgi:hypothetical protein
VCAAADSSSDEAKTLRTPIRWRMMTSEGRDQASVHLHVTRSRQRSAI